jgi:putative ABC transport system permease protein
MAAYQADRLLQNLLLILTMIIVFMALIGVLGQHFLVIRKRRKELAVRKVMGAGYQQLVWVLSRKYVLLFVISWLAASVLSYALTRSWLMHFASRLNSVELYYILPMVLGTILLLILLAWGAHRALMESPARVLKEE